MSALTWRGVNAITLWPEWAWAVTALGKRVENRKSRLPPSCRGRLYLHAGAHLGGRPGRVATSEAYDSVRWRADREGAGHLVPGLADWVEVVPRSAIVARARVVQVDDPKWCRPLPPWGLERAWHWHLCVTLPDAPIPCGGAQGFWKPAVPRDVRWMPAPELAVPARSGSCPVGPQRR